MDTTEFAERLDNTIVPSSFSEAEKQQEYEPLIRYIIAHIPKSLYKYRRCDERSIDSFDKGRMWAATPESMNDGFDSRLFYNKEKSFRWFDQKISNAAEDAYEKTMSRNIEEVRESFKAEGVSALSSFASLAQRAIKICCLSETIDSPSMWAHYAADESGFALEYDFRTNAFSSFPTANGRSCNCSLYPIIYGDKRYTVPSEYIQYLLASHLLNTLRVERIKTYPKYSDYLRMVSLTRELCPDEFIPTKIALNKSKEWENEAEWRLFCSSDDYEFQSAKNGYIINEPVALYLGRRISPVYEKFLKGIAAEKGIQVYKMQLDDNSPTYKLHPNPIIL